MPRFVRNAYIVGGADGVASRFSTGPRERGGWLSADITLCTPDGAVSDAIEVTAGGSWPSGGQPEGAAHAYVRIPAGMSFTVDTLADGRRELHIVQQPHEPTRREQAAALLTETDIDGLLNR